MFLVACYIYYAYSCIAHREKIYMFRSLHTSTRKQLQSKLSDYHAFNKLSAYSILIVKKLGHPGLVFIRNNIMNFVHRSMASSSRNATNYLCMLESKVQSEVHRLSNKSHTTSRLLACTLVMMQKLARECSKISLRCKTKRKAVQVVQSDVGQQHVQYNYALPDTLHNFFQWTCNSKRRMMPCT